MRKNLLLRFLMTTCFSISVSRLRAEEPDLEKLRAESENSAAGAVAYGEALRVLGLHRDSLRAFEHAVALDPHNAVARTALGHQLIDNRWVTRAERDSSKRTARVRELTAQFARKFGRETKVEDCHPNSPFLILMETSSGDDKGFSIAFAASILKNLACMFRERFGDLCEADDMLHGEVIVVYLFSNAEDYAADTNMPKDSFGHVDSEPFAAYAYRDTPIPIPTLLALCSQQLLLTAIERKQEDPSKRQYDCTGWLIEGVGPYFAAYQYNPDGKMILGGKDSFALKSVKSQVQQGKCKGLSQLMLMTWKETSALGKSVETSRAVAAEASSLWYYLETAEDSKFRIAFDQYLALEIESKGTLETARRCFGDLDSVDAKFRSFVSSAK